MWPLEPDKFLVVEESEVEESEDDAHWHPRHVGWIHPQHHVNMALLKLPGSLQNKASKQIITAASKGQIISNLQSTMVNLRSTIHKVLPTEGLGILLGSV